MSLPYVDGSVKRMRLINFVSYRKVELFPGSSLNFVIGPNGTGKSTIVSALCLGLAGKPSLLGRGDKIGLFVKKGEAKATVELELARAEGGDVVVRREICAASNASTWFLNGRSASQKQVEELVSSFNIQLSNLCQFLPQEKVGEFAKLSCVDRLEAVEMSLGSSDLYDLHQRLKVMQKSRSNTEATLLERSTRLEKLSHRQQLQTHDVELFHSYQRYNDYAQLLAKKRVWLEYELTRGTYLELRLRVDAAAQEERRLSQLVAPLVEQQQQKRRLQGEHTQLLRRKMSGVDEITKKIRSLQEAMDKSSDKVDEERQAVVESRAEAEDREKRISAAQKILDGWKEELRTLCAEDAGAAAAAGGDGGREVPGAAAAMSSSCLALEARRLTEQLQELAVMTAERSAERSQLATRLRVAEDDLRRLECDVRRVQDAVAQRAERLSHSSPHSVEAYRWLEANRHRFRGFVYEPIALTLTPHDGLAARYLENHISANDLRAFVFETRDDMETFLRVMRDEKKLKVNAVRAPAKKPEDFHPRTPLSQISRPPYGFSSYLRELFDAPPLVMSFLCEHYHVHDVPVGTETTTENLEKVLSELSLREFYTTMSQYRMRTSRYTGDLITTSSGLRPAQLLTASSVAAEELTAVTSKREEVTREAATLRDHIATLTDTLRELALRDNLLRESKRALDKKRGLRAELQRKIQLKERTIDSLCAGSVSLDEVVAASNQRVLKLHTEAAQTLRKLADSLQVLLTLQQEVVMMNVQSGELAQSHAALSTSIAESTNSLQAAQAELVKLQQEKRRLYQVCRDLLLKSKEVCGLGPDEEAPPEMQQALEGGPETLDEIDAAIEDARTRAGLLNINSQVLEEFENRRVAIEELQGEVETLRKTLGEQQRHLDKVKPQWLEPLGVIISHINAKFSSYLKTLDCAGEVDLFTDNEEDYAGYGLRVRVKFRLESSLHELTAHHQSGGERGVCTVLFLMALQSLHRCPLRVMDEINQGMDSTNERRVFDIVVDTACSTHTGQSFFITPKLLPNLNFRPEVKVHIVFNGPGMIANPSTSCSTSSFFFGWDKDAVAKAYKK